MQTLNASEVKLEFDIAFFECQFLTLFNIKMTYIVKIRDIVGYMQVLYRLYFFFFIDFFFHGRKAY